MKIKPILIFFFIFSIALLIPVATTPGIIGDIVLDRYFKEPGKLPAPLFPHWFHRIRFKCKVCHPAIFKMKKGENDITMAKILRGEFCGRCHDGTIAWPVNFDACPKCHSRIVNNAKTLPKPMEKAGADPLAWKGSDEAAQALPKDNKGNIDWIAALVNGSISPKDTLDPKAKTGTPLRLNLLYKGKNMPDAMFPHYAHTIWLDCNNCHIDIFLMQAGQSKMTMEGIFSGGFCAVCHGKVAFPIDNCFRCHPQK